MCTRSRWGAYCTMYELSTTIGLSIECPGVLINMLSIIRVQYECWLWCWYCIIISTRRRVNVDLVFILSMQPTRRNLAKREESSLSFQKTKTNANVEWRAKRSGAELIHIVILGLGHHRMDRTRRFTRLFVRRTNCTARPRARNDWLIPPPPGQK